METQIMHSIISEVYECIAQDNNITKEEFITLCKSEKLFISDLELLLSYIENPKVSF